MTIRNILLWLFTILRVLSGDTSKGALLVASGSYIAAWHDEGVHFFWWQEKEAIHSSFVHTWIWKDALGKALANPGCSHG